jgi:Domain of unknown function DUF29
MAARPTEPNIDLAPADEPVRAEYERDFYSWLMEQARYIRASQWNAVDRENLAEEIESLGREQFNKLESALRVLLAHILKWDHQPQRRSRSWSVSIKDQRIAFDDVLEDNPGLKSRLDEALARAYRRVRLKAAEDTGLDEDAFPEACGYSWDDILTRQFTL